MIYLRAGVTRFSADEIRALVEELTNEVGSSWLSTAQEVKAGEDIHPLAQWLLEAERDLRRGEHSQTMLRLAYLAHSIAALRQASVEGAEQRVARLTVGDQDFFGSTVHELQAAAAFVQTGHQVQFIAEGDSRSPDLLIDRAIEIECKHKPRDTARDRRRYALYQLLRRRILAAVHNSPGAAGLYLEATFHSEPDRELIDSVLQQAQIVVAPTGPERVSRTHGNCQYQVRSLAPQPRTSRALEIPRHLWQAFDVVDSQGKVPRLDTGEMHIQKRTLLAFRCTIPEDRVRSVERSLRSGARQLSGDLPGAIQIDVTPIAPKLVGANTLRTRTAVDNLFRNYRRVSGLIIAEDHFERDDDERWMFGQLLTVLRNPEAHRPLPPLLGESTPD